MTWSKVVLIGHSSAGKTSLVQALGGTLARADMDLALGTGVAPHWKVALDWMAGNTEPVMAISVHIITLIDLVNAKRTKSDPKFEDICFVYLHKSKSATIASLNLRKADGTWRDLGNKSATEELYEYCDPIFDALSDVRWETEGELLEVTAQKLRDFLATNGTKS